MRKLVVWGLIINFFILLIFKIAGMGLVFLAMVFLMAGMPSLSLVFHPGIMNLDQATLVRCCVALIQLSCNLFLLVVCATPYWRQLLGRQH